mgnify:CR=1 FL=1
MNDEKSPVKGAFGEDASKLQSFFPSQFCTALTPFTKTSISPSRKLRFRRFKLLVKLDSKGFNLGSRNAAKSIFYWEKIAVEDDPQILEKSESWKKEAFNLLIFTTKLLT